jgi:hypothetical protein
MYVCREKLRQAELKLATASDQLQQAEAANAAAKKGLSGPVSTFGAPIFTTKGITDPRSLDMRLAQELISARVSAESAVRRAELVEAERSRLQQTLAENQVSWTGGWHMSWCACQQLGRTATFLSDTLASKC